MTLRCEVAACHGPATVEIVALWREGDPPAWSHDPEDIVTVVGAACDDDRAAVLAECRRWASQCGYRSPDPGVVIVTPLGVYARVIDTLSRTMESR